MLMLSSVCLARGRSFIVPVTPLVETCDEWHRSPIADIWDNSIISSTVLRRDLVNLISEVKESCSARLSKTTDRSKLVERYTVFPHLHRHVHASLTLLASKRKSTPSSIIGIPPGLTLQLTLHSSRPRPYHPTSKSLSPTVDSLSTPP
jgi:hypothetical protein